MTTLIPRSRALSATRARLAAPPPDRGLTNNTGRRGGSVGLQPCRASLPLEDLLIPGAGGLVMMLSVGSYQLPIPASRRQQSAHWLASTENRWLFVGIGLTWQAPLGGLLTRTPAYPTSGSSRLVLRPGSGRRGSDLRRRGRRARRPHVAVRRPDAPHAARPRCGPARRAGWRWSRRTGTFR